MTLRSFKEVVGFGIGATGGALGKVDDVYFDDERWTVRYLVADVGSWLSGRKVLISPHAIVRIDSNAEIVETQLTRSEVENSPPIETDRPISRRMEDEYNRHFHYPPDWAGDYATGLWGFGALPFAGLEPVLRSAQAQHEAPRATSPEDDGAVHLRSGREVTGYRVAATDRAIGHIENFLFDEDSWAIRCLVIDTRDWWPGRHVLVPPEQVERVSWAERSVHLGISRAEVERSPEYDPRRPRESSVGFRA
jgi:uncharacterized protein YrrD